MRRSLENLLGHQISATNGAMGTVADFLFLDDAWKVRYVVVAAGGWMNRREVLISTDAVREIVDAASELRVEMTREVVYASPDIDTDKPVTRQKEILLADHYGWKPYWHSDPFLGVDLPSERIDIDEQLEGSNPHLRSFREITAYAAEGNGRVADLIVDDLDWRMVGLVLSKGGGDMRILRPRMVREIDWTNRVIRHDAQGVLPPFDPSAAVNPRRVVRHFDYRGLLHHTTVLPEDTERNE